MKNSAYNNLKRNYFRNLFSIPSSPPNKKQKQKKRFFTKNIGYHLP
jgi:hypothetical protein